MSRGFDPQPFSHSRSLYAAFLCEPLALGGENSNGPESAAADSKIGDRPEIRFGHVARQAVPPPKVAVFARLGPKSQLPVPDIPEPPDRLRLTLAIKSGRTRYD